MADPGFELEIIKARQRFVVEELMRLSSATVVEIDFDEIDLGSASVETSD